VGPRLTLRPGSGGSARGWPGACRCATRTSRPWERATAPRATRSTAHTRGRTTGALAWAPPSTSSARAGRSSTRAGAATYAKIPNALAVRAMGSEPTAAADYFDAELTRPVPDGVLAIRTTDHFQRLQRPPFGNRERLPVDVLRRAPGRLRDRGGAGPEPRRALRPPRPGPCARGLLPGAARALQPRVRGARPGPVPHRATSTPASRRSTRRPSAFRGPSSRTRSIPMTP
jgi:hypothetical protein